MTSFQQLIEQAVEAGLRKVLNCETGAASGFKLVGREEACKLLDCSPDYFRDQIEPHVPVVAMPSAGSKREFRRWDVEDLKAFVTSRKRAQP